MFPGTQTAITSHFTPQKPPKNGTAPHPTIHNPIHSLWITLRSRPAAGARTKPNGRQEPRRRGRRLEGVRGCVLGLRGCVWCWCVWVSGVVCCRVLLPVRVLVCLGRMLCTWCVCRVAGCDVGSVCDVGLVLRSGSCVVFWCSRTPVWLCPRSPRCPRFVCLFALWCPPGLVS